MSHPHPAVHTALCWCSALKTTPNPTPQGLWAQPKVPSCLKQL